MNMLTSSNRRRPPRPSISLALTAADGQNGTPMDRSKHSSSSAPQQTLQYPLPISLQKLPKALRLFIIWKTAEAWAERNAPIADNPYLHIPNTPTARSRTSGGSSRRGGTSVSESTYDATELTSVISFDGSPTTAKELASFDGKIYKQRTRKPFDPVGKAKTNLVRWLGSCSRCRERRVPVSSSCQGHFRALF